jgi:hypothetical protein
MAKIQVLGVHKRRLQPSATSTPAPIDHKDYLQSSLGC